MNEISSIVISILNVLKNNEKAVTLDFLNESVYKRNTAFEKSYINPNMKRAVAALTRRKVIKQVLMKDEVEIYISICNLQKVNSLLRRWEDLNNFA